jgi:hypothetical protein
MMTDDGCEATCCLNVINPYLGYSVWGFSSKIEISVRKFKIRLITEVLVYSV